MSVDLELTPEGRIRRALFTMPYAGSMVTKVPKTPLELHDLVPWLEELRARLVEHAGHQQETEAELYELRRQRDAVRAFLGTGDQ